MEERKEPQGAGELVTERARIAGVEAGIAAGLVAASRRPGASAPPSRRLARGCPQSADAVVTRPDVQLRRRQPLDSCSLLRAPGLDRPADPAGSSRSSSTSNRRPPQAGGPAASAAAAARCGASVRRTGTTPTQSSPTSAGLGHGLRGVVFGRPVRVRLPRPRRGVVLGSPAPETPTVAPERVSQSGEPCGRRLPSRPRCRA